MRKKIIFALNLFVVCSCTGPYTPFGANNKVGFKNSLSITESTSKEINEGDFANEQWSPQYLTFHKSVSFKFRPPKAIVEHLEDFQWQVKYNDEDVGEHWTLFNGQLITKKNSFFTPKFQHRLEVLFVDKKTGKNYRYFWGYPSCPVFTSTPLNGEIKNTLGSPSIFPSEVEVLNMIEKISHENAINPNFFAGLIAAVSGFNVKKVGTKRQIGPAQIGPIESIQIKSGHPGWPHSKELDKSNPIVTRMLIKTNRVTEQQDWRLSTEKSLLGAAYYLKKIKEYWETEENQSLLKSVYPNSHLASLDTIFLASYLLGPNKIHYLINRFRDRWTQGNEYNEYNTQINLTYSFCSEFSVPKQDNEQGVQHQ